MKLIIAIIRDLDQNNVVDQLVQNHFKVTKMSSTGGFLRQGNVTLMIGTDEVNVGRAIKIIQEACNVPEPGQYRATIFVVDATHFEQT